MKFVEHAKDNKLVKDFLDRGIISVDSSVEQVERQLKKRGATGAQLDEFAKLVDGYNKSKEEKPVARKTTRRKSEAKVFDKNEEEGTVAKKTTRRKLAD